jgi:hypothetical protein
MGWGILCSLIAIVPSFIGKYFFNKYATKLEHLERVKLFVMEDETAEPTKMPSTAVEFDESDSDEGMDPNDPNYVHTIGT